MQNDSYDTVRRKGGSLVGRGGCGVAVVGQHRNICKYMCVISTTAARWPYDIDPMVN
jgi:hypothetical protein